MANSRKITSMEFLSTTKSTNFRWGPWGWPWRSTASPGLKCKQTADICLLNKIQQQQTKPPLWFLCVNYKQTYKEEKFQLLVQFYNLVQGLLSTFKFHKVQISVEMWQFFCYSFFQTRKLVKNFFCFQSAKLISRKIWVAR